MLINKLLCQKNSKLNVSYIFADKVFNKNWLL